MPSGASQYRVGDVGASATVLVGDHLYNITFNVSDVAAATELLRTIRESGRPTYHGPLLRWLDPVVLVNRAESIKDIAAFFADEGISMLYVCGMAGIGKSTLVRGAIELRRAETPAVWIGCENLDVDHLLAEIGAGMGLGTERLLRDVSSRLATRIASVLGAVTTPGIVILDGFEDLLDEKGNLNSSDIADAMDAFATLEHKLKVLVTTRQLPNGIGAGSAGIRILHLGGLSKPMSQELLRSRMHQDAQQSPLAIPPELLEKLGGHPKIIELVASVTSELPIERLTAGLLPASDVGAFVLGEVFARIGLEEMQVLRAALVFRSGFSFDALKATYDAIDAQHVDIEAPVRALVRRAVLDAIAGPPLAYYLHPILRDAVSRDAGQEAATHAAAASWYAQTPVVAANIATWEDTLYHLRRAAEVGKSGDHVEAYDAWLREYESALEYAGWSRRIVTELKVLSDLVIETPYAQLAQFRLGQLLWILAEYDEAIEVLDRSASNPHNVVGDALILIKAKLGNALTERNRLGEAARLADEIEPMVNASGDVQYRLRYCELRFAIARKSIDAIEMMRWAKETLELAEEWAAKSPSLGTRDAVAEAHFNLGVSCLRAQDWEGMFSHFVQQLRIKLEIRKINGVSAGLLNLGNLISVTDPDRSAALLLTAEQIYLETEVAMPDFSKRAERAVAELVADASKHEVARKRITEISPDLLPFYERSLMRWEGIATAAASSGVPGSARPR